ncbi:MAG TPA: hypothetical protein VEJ19_00055 [Nitrososphaerales archaeon]|nr:hypothetical protein [Nitrososphaerales archaeon]
MRTSALVVAAMLVVLAAGIGIGWGFQATVLPSGTVSTTSGTQGPASLTLVITTGNAFNSTVGDQPAYYVLTPNGLQSSAQLTFPIDTLFKLTIVCYDNGNASLLAAQYANVEGTVNGTMTYVNNDNVNSTYGGNGIVLSGGQTVTSVPPDLIAHTFTIPSLNINIPVPANSTVTAYLKITTAGSFQWMCETACGAGAAGTLAAMDTPGWMTGDVEVS